MKKQADSIIYSPSDLIRYIASPFSSWLDRYYLENPDAISPDEETDEDRLLSRTGDEHERAVLAELRESAPTLVVVPRDNFELAHRETLRALERRPEIIFQAALATEHFAGYADFLILDSSGKYQVWDTKLARSMKPYYAVQLCCYAEMLAAETGEDMHERIGIILGTNERVELRLADFIHYYRNLKRSFLAMQDGFTGNLADCPEPLPRADHGRWSSRAQQLVLDQDHLVQVAGITVGQIKKLKVAGITSVAQLGIVAGIMVPKLNGATLEKLSAQARLQCTTREARKQNPDAQAAFEVLPHVGANGQPAGLALLPPRGPHDVFFDMEGYPLIPGGLEYLFGAVTRDGNGKFDFRDLWAHNRLEEKRALEQFIDWVYALWRKSPLMHIYHYAAYEVSSVRRLSTRHDTRQDEVDELLRNNVFVDLYQIVRQSLRVGEEGYSIKLIERLYRGKRAGSVTTGGDSIVQYANWIQTRESPDWRQSAILKAIRDYNEDDCKSTAELADWLRAVAAQRGVIWSAAQASAASLEPKTIDPKVAPRQALAEELRAKGDAVSIVLGDLVDFHRREQKPLWWRMFDRAAASRDELRDDPACVEGVEAWGSCTTDNRSLCHSYRFDPLQECKLATGDTVMFTHNLDATFTVTQIDIVEGELGLKIGKKSLDTKYGAAFPRCGSLLKNEFVSPHGIPDALSAVAKEQLRDALHPPVASLLERLPPASPLQSPEEPPLTTAIRVAQSMSGGCLLIQGPPGTGKTYTAAYVIAMLLQGRHKVGLASNSHKAIINLLNATVEAVKSSGNVCQVFKVGGDEDDPLLAKIPGLEHIKNSADARAIYSGGVIGGTAWLFSRPEWEGALDFLFIDEAGQVPLANAVAMARSAHNLVLLGDQMQLEQPIQGSHPGDAGFSALQYGLKDTRLSSEDAPILHSVVPQDLGIFLGESRRMHPEVCRFISETIYAGRLTSLPECALQRIAVPDKGRVFVNKEAGIVFSGIEHEGNIQQSGEEVERVRAIFGEMLGRSYTNKSGETRALVLNDFLFIAPYNAQVAALRAALPTGARVGSVDKFQGQEAPVCILSLCSSYGEYGSRGLRFILDRARINVAISRAQCLAIVVADPRIANSPAGSLDEMRLINTYCKLVAHAAA